MCGIECQGSNLLILNVRDQNDELSQYQGPFVITIMYLYIKKKLNTKLRQKSLEFFQALGIRKLEHNNKHGLICHSKIKGKLHFISSCLGSISISYNIFKTFQFHTFTYRFISISYIR